MSKYLTMAIGATLYLLTTACSGNNSTKTELNSYDKTCGYFQDLAQETNFISLSNLERNHYIMDKLSKALEPSDGARAGWEAISSAEPEQRYELFKSLADSELKIDWQCQSMSNIATMVGQ